MIQKNKRYRNKTYLEWVKTQPCSYCGAPSDDTHHGIGLGLSGMGTKADDLAVMPVCREHHTAIHNGFARLSGQWEFIAKTLIAAIKEGVL